MTTLKQAFELIMHSVPKMGAETVDLASSLGRVLAQDIIADIDMPPFNKSAMDGYACRQEDIKNDLKVIDYLPAGSLSKKKIGPNECVQIMTGAVVPEGADCVLMVEFTEKIAADKIRYLKDKTRGNICWRGEDVKTGDLLLKKGELIRAEHIAILAAFGYTEILVSQRPRVAVLSTGDELVVPTKKPGLAAIRDGNSWQLAAQIEVTGALAKNYGIIPDSEKELDTALKKAFEENDLVIFSGGVSKGDLDLVPKVLLKNDMELIFEELAIKPGRPTTFALGSNGVCFALPGNPVAVFVVFEKLVKPFLFKMMGCDYRSLRVSAKLAHDFKGGRRDRVSFYPAKFLSSSTVEILEYHGPANITSLCDADGLVHIPEGKCELSSGDLVEMDVLN